MLLHIAGHEEQNIFETFSDLPIRELTMTKLSEHT